MFYEPTDSDPDSCESSRADTVAKSETVERVAPTNTSDRVDPMKTADRAVNEQIAETATMPENRDKVSPKEATVNRYYNV